MTWERAKCPKCGHVYDQWDGIATDGSGGIIFEDGSVELGDIIVTGATLFCPNPSCSFLLKDKTYTELEEWFEENKIDETEQD